MYRKYFFCDADPPFQTPTLGMHAFAHVMDLPTHTNSYYPTGDNKDE